MARGAEWPSGIIFPFFFILMWFLFSCEFCRGNGRVVSKIRVRYRSLCSVLKVIYNTIFLLNLPLLEAEFDGNLVTCCDGEMIEIMTSQLTMLDEFVGRCPACKQNLMNTFCYFTCSPHHSTFLVPTELYEGR